MSNRDLLGRETNRLRIVEPIVSVDDRIDQHSLTTEDKLYHAIATPRPCLTLVIKNLEAWLTEKEPGSYAHNQISATIELHRETLKRQTNER